MADRSEPTDLHAIFEILKVVRKGSEDDYEIRSSADGKIWGVKAFTEDPKKPTYILYTGADAKELAADLADLDLEDDDDDEEEEDDEADED